MNGCRRLSLIAALLVRHVEPLPSFARSGTLGNLLFGLSVPHAQLESRDYRPRDMLSLAAFVVRHQLDSK
jgi:hypothetical protein